MIDHIAAALGRYSYRPTSERELQEGLAVALRSAGIEFRREFVLNPRERLDFLCKGGIAIEVKVDGSLQALTRQVHGYLQDERVTGCIVVSTRARHGLLRGTISGKPVRSMVVRP